MRRVTPAMLMVAVLFGLAGCATTYGKEDLEASRGEVQSVATTDAPQLLEAIDGEVSEAWGEWQAGGAKNHFRLSYAVTIRLAGTSATNDDVAAAMEDLGYEIVQNDDRALVGTRGNLELYGSPNRLEFTGPYLRTETGLVSFAREDIDLGPDLN